MTLVKLMTNIDITKNKITFFQEIIINWYSINGRKFPWRKKHISNYQRIISELLLQRTKAETINKFFPVFIEQYPSWKVLAYESQEKLEEFLKPIGLYRQRSTKLINLAKEMIKRNGRFPKNKKELKSLIGLGQYISNAVLLFVHNLPKPLLDVNMARVIERFFGPRKLVDIRYDPYLQELSQRVVEHEKKKEINWGILDYAYYMCSNKNPKCSQCKLSKKCQLSVMS